MRGKLHQANGGENALLVWVGHARPAVAVGLTKDGLDGWELWEGDGDARLVLDHNGTRISIDFSPGAGRP